MKSITIFRALRRAVFAGGLFAVSAVAMASPPELEIPPAGDLSLSAIPVCYDFGCRNRTVVNLPINDWKGVGNWFSPAAATPEEERDQIKKAVGWMEVVIGWHTPTHKDIAFDLPPNSTVESIKTLFPGQLDCIDETINATTYLNLFAQRGLLRHHEVIEPVYRRSLLDQHWAAQIRDIRSGERFVVDSWFQPNGYLPAMQKSKEWQNVSLFSALEDTSGREPGETTPSLWHRLWRSD